MNGVHCQTSSVMTAPLGNWVIQSGCGAVPPKIRHTSVSTPLNRPYSGLSRACFHSSAAATGTTRNGAIIMVRTTPRPKNVRSSSSATSSPSTRLISTTATVSTTVVTIEERSAASDSTAR
jgi:hypothetical protein